MYMCQRANRTAHHAYAVGTVVEEHVYATFTCCMQQHTHTHILFFFDIDLVVDGDYDVSYRSIACIHADT